MKKIIAILFLFSSTLIHAQHALNNLPLDDSIQKNYSFIVSGHFHGSSSNVSGFPASSILANIDLLNNSNSTFIATTGDMFLDVTNDIPNYKNSFFSKIKIPIYNAVGNHDITKMVYEENFGKTWFAFQINKQYFIFLNSEANDGSIKGEQLDFLKNNLILANQDNSIKQVFIFSHRPLWAEEDENLNSLFLENTQSDFGINFNVDVYPLLENTCKSKAVYWFAGSLGGEAPASFFYYQKQKNLFYIQSAIRDLPRDAVLKVNINDEELSFETISLNQNPAPKLESCSLELWKEKRPVENFNWRLLPLYIKQMVFHRYFWYGFGIALLLFYLLKKIILFYRRKKLG